jgi:hypothetical protein
VVVRADVVTKLLVHCLQQARIVLAEREGSDRSAGGVAHLMHNRLQFLVGTRQDTAAERGTRKGVDLSREECDWQNSPGMDNYISKCVGATDGGHDTGYLIELEFWD